MDTIEPADPSQGQFLRPQFQPRQSSAVNLPTPEPTSSQPTGRRRAASLRSNPSSIRLQRPPSSVRATSSDNQSTNHLNRHGSFSSATVPPPEESEAREGNRRRSSSEPRPGQWSAPTPAVLPRLQPGEPMHTVMEETSPQSPVAQRRPISELRPAPVPTQSTQSKGNRSMMRRTSSAALDRFSRNRATTVSCTTPVPGTDVQREYDSHIVDVLDVIDPEVSALSTLTNVQNSLFIPNLGSLLNRNQTYILSPPTEVSSGEETSVDGDHEEEKEMKGIESRPPLERPITSISSVLEPEEPHFAVLPEGSTLEGWSYHDIEELNDHVRHMLHSRRSKFKRSMKGFIKYVSKPLGFLVTLYATLITLFGLAWVLFLIGWVNVGGRQLYIINVIDNVLVALFAIMGDGLAPFRAVDTYHMLFIAHYTFLTWRIRRKRHLPNLKDKNDLPSRCEFEADPELGDSPKEEEKEKEEEENEFIVLSRRQQQKLQHHQEKFAKSHTFYKPHETVTHYAFPLRMLIAIVLLLDCHSLFQIALGACTWGISYHVRPFALTTVILCCSIVCNISGGVLILIGDRRTRKKDVVERMFRQQLTKEAMKKMQKKRKNEEKYSSDQGGLLSDSSSSAPQMYQGT